MKSSQLKSSIMAFVAAFIWGTAFVAQSVSTDKVPPFAFNALRSAIATVCLLLISQALDVHRLRRDGVRPRCDKKVLALGGICCGVFLAAATNFQQAALADTAPGKAAFITALYVVLVPVLGIFFKKRASLGVWISVILSVVGLYFLCVTGTLDLRPSDIMLLACALGFALQILCVDYFVQRVDPIKLSCAQFFVTSVISAVCAAIFEQPTVQGAVDCLWPILYVGVFSSCGAYTLQILAQKGSDPTVVTIILSLESVISVISGALILRDRLTDREYLGCVLMFAAVILAQIPLPMRKKQSDTD